MLPAHQPNRVVGSRKVQRLRQAVEGSDGQARTCQVVTDGLIHVPVDRDVADLQGEQEEEESRVKKQRTGKRGEKRKRRKGKGVKQDREDNSDVNASGSVSMGLNTNGIHEEQLQAWECTQQTKPEARRSWYMHARDRGCVFHST